MSLLRARWLRWVLGLTGLLAAALISFYCGIRFGRVYEFQNIVYELPRDQNLKATFRRLAHRQPTYGQFQQDLWVALKVGGGKKNGYYVDVGSGDGVFISNTYLLDQMGWKGVCIDAFPRDMGHRTCQVFQQPVFNQSGKKVQFRAAGDLGGIESGLGTHKGELAAAPLVDLVTATLDEILAIAKSPHWIDYMNIDVEGVEYEALQGLSLDRYAIGSFTIEHNYEPVKRDLIRKLMEGKGYVRVRSWEVDDWYVHRSLASQYNTFLSYGSREYIFGDALRAR